METGHLEGLGVSELQDYRVYPVAALPSPNTQGGRAAFLTTTALGAGADTDGQRFWGLDGESQVWFRVPRVDRRETVTQKWHFNTGAAPFDVTGTTKVTNLNADLLDDMNTATAATGSTIVARESDGRAKVADPVDPTDATNLRWIRAELRNADDKKSVKCAAIAALADSYTLSANEIEKTTNGAFPDLDGVTVNVGDYFGLLYEGGGGNNYYLGSQNAVNGLWKLLVKGDGSTKWKAQRAENFDVTSEVTAGAYFFVDQGTQLKNSKWALFTDDPISLKTNAPKGVAAVLAAGGSLSANTYYYKVTFVDFSGKEAATDTEVSETTAGGNLTINLSWTSYAEAVSYRVYRTTTSGNYGATSLAGTTTGTTFSDTGVSLSSGTPPTASALEFGKIASNSFYQQGNGIVINGDVIHAIRSTNYDANAIIYASSTTALSMSTLFKINVASTRLELDADILFTGAQVIDTTAGALTLDTGDASAINFNTDSTLRWTVSSTGILQSNGAQTIQTSTGALTLATAAGNGNIVLSPHGTGNVGIGTTSPGVKLTVSDATTDGTPFRLIGAVGFAYDFRSLTGVSGAGRRLDIQVGSGSGEFSLSNTSREFLRILDSGNVGIGTTSPAKLLTVFGADPAAIAFGTSDFRITGTGGNTHLDFARSNTLGVTWIQSQFGDAAARDLLLNPLGGNVGIGTTSPSYKLQVNGSIDIVNVQSSTTGAFVRATTNGATGDFSFGADDGSGAGNNAFVIYDRINSAYRFLINNSGNVGIGTTSPSTALHLQKSVASDLELRVEHTVNNGAFINFLNSGGSLFAGVERSSGGALFNNSIAFAGIVGTRTVDPLQLGTDSTIRLTIDTSGNVGIGTTSPATLLDVNGVINAATGYRIANAAAAGVILRGNGTNYVASTATYPNTVTANRLLYASGTNVIADLTTTSDRVLVSTGGVPTWTLTMPAGLLASDSNPLQKGKYFNVGDGASTTITLTHNFGTTDVVVQVWKNSGNYETIWPTFTRRTSNTVVLVFVTAPGSNAYRAAVLASA